MKVYEKPELLIVNLIDDDALVAAARCSGASDPDNIQGCVS